MAFLTFRRVFRRDRVKKERLEFSIPRFFSCASSGVSGFVIPTFLAQVTEWLTIYYTAV